MQKPRLFKYQDRVQLCFVSYEKGEITNIHGPVQCIGDAGVDAESFANKLVELLMEGLHTSKVLELHELPEHIQKEIEDQVSSSSSESESSE